MKNKPDEETEVVRGVKKILVGMLVPILLMILVTVGYVAFFPDRDNGFLVLVRYGGSVLAVLLGIVLTHGGLLRHIVRNW